MLQVFIGGLAGYGLAAFVQDLVKTAKGNRRGR